MLKFLKFPIDQEIDDDLLFDLKHGIIKILQKKVPNGHETFL